MCSVSDVSVVALDGLSAQTVGFLCVFSFISEAPFFKLTCWRSN